MASIGLGILLALVGVALGVALGRYVWPARDDADAMARVVTEREVSRLADESGRLRAEVAKLDEERRTAIDKIARLEAREAERGDYQERQKREFQDIAQQVLGTTKKELSETSRREVKELLTPLSTKIEDFRKAVAESYGKERDEVMSLQGQIRALVETSRAVGSQADGLAKALRGDSQMLGRWGELVLERILEAAGLREGIEFVSQGRGLGLKSEEGGSQRPDYILQLPEQRTMVIDVKTPLTSYDRLTRTVDEAERQLLEAQLVRDVRGHIDDLASKGYQDIDKLSAHECVLMFIPIEGAIAAALTRAPELFTYAWDRRVVLVGPSTLMMTARTVGSIWRYERQGQNTQEIARLAGVLCDKISTSVEDLLTAGKRLADASEAHNKALAKLSGGRGNALAIGKSIRGLGVKTRHLTPRVLIDGVLIYPGDKDAADAAENDAEGDAPVDMVAED